MLGHEGPCIEMDAMVGQGLAQDFYHGDMAAYFGAIE